MNYVAVMGRLTRDPDYRTATSGTGVARFTVAVERRFRKDGDPEADFFNVVTFGKTADFAEKWLRKATKVVVQGELRNNSYTNKSGVKVNTVEIAATGVEFAESAGSGGGTARTQNRKESRSNDFIDLTDSDEELPF